MNVIKKYWDCVYQYILLLFPFFCFCAGAFFTWGKIEGYYPHTNWNKVLFFDTNQLIYLSISVFFIYQNKKDSSYITKHLRFVKSYIVLAAFLQYNLILYFFPSVHVWECTFLFFAFIVFLFDSKLMFINLLSYFVSFLTAHILKPQLFLPLNDDRLIEILAYRILLFILTALCIMIIVYFAERFLIEAQEENKENLHLLEKQLKYYKEMDILDTEIRKFRHDIKNHFICMESMFLSGNTEELKTYFFDLQNSISFQEKLYATGNNTIDAILHYDLSFYCEKDVQISIYGNLPAIETISSMDLCTLFSNMLSNAITAANRCTAKDAQIIIRFSGGKHYFSIEICNSIDENGLLTPHTFRSTARDRNHGYGINKIKEIIEKYDGKLEQNLTATTFTLTVFLPI